MQLIFSFISLLQCSRNSNTDKEEKDQKFYNLESYEFIDLNKELGKESEDQIEEINVNSTENRTEETIENSNSSDESSFLFTDSSDDDDEYIDHYYSHGKFGDFWHAENLVHTEYFEKCKKILEDPDYTDDFKEEITDFNNCFKTYEVNYNKLINCCDKAISYCKKCIRDTKDNQMPFVELKASISKIYSIFEKLDNYDDKFEISKKELETSLCEFKECFFDDPPLPLYRIETYMGTGSRYLKCEFFKYYFYRNKIYELATENGLHFNSDQ